MTIYDLYMTAVDDGIKTEVYDSEQYLICRGDLREAMNTYGNYEIVSWALENGKLIIDIDIDEDDEIIDGWEE